jgi:hypothetical protein
MGTISITFRLCADSFNRGDLIESSTTANTRQLLIRRPFIKTVQSTHWPWSQPFLLPVKRKTFAQSVKQHYTRIRRQLTELSKAAGPAWQLRDNSASPYPHRSDDLETAVLYFLASARFDFAVPGCICSFHGEARAMQ